MPLGIGVQVEGAREFNALARRLRDAGDQGLMREVRKALDDKARPLENAVRTDLPRYLPNRYAAVLAKAMKVKGATRSYGREVSVRLVLTAKGSKRPRQVGPLDNPGTLRHPVCGRYRYNQFGSRSRNPWVAQRVRAGFWSDHLDGMRKIIRRDVVEAVHTVAQKITKG